MWHSIHEVLLALPIGKRLCIRVWIVTKLCNFYSELHELLQNFVTWSRVHVQNVRRAITGWAACFPLGTAASTYLNLINYHIESGGHRSRLCDFGLKLSCVMYSITVCLPRFHYGQWSIVHFFCRWPRTWKWSTLWNEAGGFQSSKWESLTGPWAILSWTSPIAVEEEGNYSYCLANMIKVNPPFLVFLWGVQKPHLVPFDLFRCCAELRRGSAHIVLHSE